MGPVKQLVPISFAGGIDTKTDSKQLVPGKLIDLQNGIFLKTGAINRRWGYQMLGQGIQGTGNTITSTKAIDAFNNELLLFDGTNAFSYIPANNNWAPRGEVVSVIQTNQQIIAGNSQQLSPDFAILNGVELYAWEDSRGGIRYSAVDANTGTILSADNPLYTGMPSTIIRPRVLAFNGLFYVLFGNGSTIGYVSINPANPGSVPASAGTLLGSRVSPVLYDAISTTLNGNQLAVLSFFNDVANSRQVLQITVFTGNLSIAGSNFISTINSPFTFAAVPPSITVDPNGNYWCTYVPGSVANVIQVAFFRTVTFSVLATANVYGPTGTVAASAGVAVNTSRGSFGYSLQVYVEVVGSQTYNQVLYQNVMDDTGTTSFPAVSAPVFVRSVGLASKPFINGSSAFVNVAFQSQQQSTYFTLDSTGMVVGKVFAGLCGGLIANSDNLLPQVQTVSPGIFKYANLIKGVANTEAGVVLSLLGVNATKLDFFDTNHFLSVGINAGFYTVGGILQHYDGVKYVEHGFHVYPEAFTLTPQNNGGGAMAAGTYFYAITYEWADNTDATDISTPSIATAVTVTGPNNSVQLVIPTLRLTKKTKVKIVIYRTQSNGTLLYRITSAIAPLYSDPTVDSVTFVDLLADASITANGLMYTQPLLQGSNPVVPNSAPPSCSLITTFANRLFIAGLDDPYTLWYSQQSVVNAPMQFSSLLNLRSDPDGGPITALQRMDDKLLIFKKNAIFYLTGQGPTPTGDQNDFGAPISIPSGEVGCVSQNALVVTPLGVLFQSLNGIYLLDRALNVSYKGAPVESFNMLGISSATLIPNQWVVFTTSTGGTAIVYDFYYDQWSTFTNHSAVDSVLYLGNSNLFTYANGAGQVFLQTPTTFSDNGAPIPFSLTTSWLSFANIQGYQRVFHALLLGTYKGTHTLNLWAGFDFDDAFTAYSQVQSDAALGVSTFGSASPFGVDSPFGGVSSGQAVYQFRYDILRKCQAIRFQITDQQTAPGNEGFSLSQFGLVVGAKKPPFRGVSIPKQFGMT